MNDRDERATDVLADAEEQGLENPASDQVDFGRDEEDGADAGGGQAGAEKGPTGR